MAKKGKREGMVESVYGQFKFTAQSVNAYWTARIKGRDTEKHLCTKGGSNAGGATKRDLWIEIVTLWISKLNTHQTQRKVGALTHHPTHHPLSLTTTTATTTGHSRDR